MIWTETVFSGGMYGMLVGCPLPASKVLERRVYPKGFPVRLRIMTPHHAPPRNVVVMSVITSCCRR